MPIRSRQLFGHRMFRHAAQERSDALFVELKVWTSCVVFASCPALLRQKAGSASSFQAAERQPMDSRSTAVGVDGSAHRTIDPTEPAWKTPVHPGSSTRASVSALSQHHSIRWPHEAAVCLAAWNLRKRASRRLEFRPVMRAPPAFSGKAQ
ncbi:hypothetical protein GN958_ATG09574 [Phytophthora infestans]|uniref:Uncharacterized protein n=1 Tax=Phytophthora infestans TaxID=4787 RepID=A0A8S9UKG6_PHYIN|nr:hypothetical protein GN958_ATG09574 [Phytophthora infestans]